MSIKQKITLAILSIIGLACILSLPYLLDRATKIDKPIRKLTATWYDTKVKISYNNAICDTVELSVYDNLDNMKLEDGNFSYLKSTHQTGGVVGYWVHMASYVSSYKVIESKQFTKTD